MPDAEPTPPGTPRPGTQPTGSNYVVELPYAQELQAMLEGRYLVEGFLGQGGMGAVYKGQQLPLKRPVAIKILAKRGEDDDFAFEERFKREAYAMASLAHPNIVQVYDCGDAGMSFLFISMELVEGGDLSDAIKGGRLTPETALKLIPQICEGLHAAHERGIVHRDIKPANIFLTADGRAKVADFGLAKKFDVQSTFVTRTGLGMGTPDYAAPEQYEGSSDIDHRADIYALGVMMYQMLTGKLPRGMAEAPSVLVPGLDPRLDAVVQKAMRQDRDHRYQSAREVREALIEIVSPRTTQSGTTTPCSSAAAPVKTPPEAPAPARASIHQAAAPARKSSAAVPIFVTVALLAGGAAWWLLTQKSPKSGTAQEVPSAVNEATPAISAVALSSAPPPPSPTASKSSVDPRLVPASRQSLLILPSQHLQ